MKTLAIISGHPGAGQTTLAVNLASGLVQKGYRVLIGTLGENHKFYNYLGIEAKQEGALDSRDTQNHPIQSSRLGMDLLVFMPGLDKSANLQMLLSIMGNTDYDYLLLMPATKADCSQLGNLFEHLLICMDFSCAKEVEELIDLEKYLQGLSENRKAISLIIPNKMNSKEWAHNSQQLFAMADYFGTERITDPIPFCERIHDLPQQGRTVWQLSQQNLQDAFHRLMEAVELL